MTFDSTKETETAGGRKVRILCVDLAGNQPIVAAITEGKTTKVFKFFENGKRLISRKSSRDLINVPRELWINVYPPIENKPTRFFYSREEADGAACKNRTACVKFLAGEGL